jgi:hypothetical protein
MAGIPDDLQDRYQTPTRRLLVQRVREYLTPPTAYRYTSFFEREKVTKSTGESYEDTRT